MSPNDTMAGPSTAIASDPNVATTSSPPAQHPDSAPATSRPRRSIKAPQRYGAEPTAAGPSTAPNKKRASTPGKKVSGATPGKKAAVAEAAKKVVRKAANAAKGSARKLSKAITTMGTSADANLLSVPVAGPSKASSPPSLAPGSSAPSTRVATPATDPPTSPPPPESPPPIPSSNTTQDVTPAGATGKRKRKPSAKADTSSKRPRSPEVDDTPDKQPSTSRSPTSTRPTRSLPKVPKTLNAPANLPRERSPLYQSHVPPSRSGSPIAEGDQPLEPLALEGYARMSHNAWVVELKTSWPTAPALQKEKVCGIDVLAFVAEQMEPTAWKAIASKSAKGKGPARSKTASKTKAVAAPGYNCESMGLDAAVAKGSK